MYVTLWFTQTEKSLRFNAIDQKKKHYDMLKIFILLVSVITGSDPFRLSWSSYNFWKGPGQRVLITANLYLL